MTNIMIGIGMVARKAAGGTPSVAYLPAISNTRLAIYSPYRMTTGYSGPVVQVCASSEPDTPVTTLDVYPDSNGDPDLAAAVAAFGSTFDLCKWYDQSGAGFHAPVLLANKRFKINPINKWGSLQPATAPPLGAWAAIPDSLVTSRQDVSIVSVTANRGSQGSNTVFGLNNTGALATYLNLIHDIGGTQALGNAFLRSKLGMVVPTIKAICCGTTSTKIHRNDDVDTLGALTASAAMQGGAIGGVRNSANSVVTGYLSANEDHYFHAVYQGQVSDADMTTLKTYLKTRFAIPAAGTWQLMCMGDSIMWGQGSSSGVGYPSRVRQYLTGATVDVQNPSTPGKTLNTINTDFNGVGKQKIETSKAKKFVLTNALTNDIAAGATLADCQTRVQTFASQVIAAGAIPLNLTVLPRRIGSWTAGMDTIRTQINAWLVDPTNQATYGFKAVDRASNPDMADPNNTTFYNADGLHITDTGYQSMAAYEGPLLNAIMAAA